MNGSKLSSRATCSFRAPARKGCPILSRNWRKGGKRSRQHQAAKHLHICVIPSEAEGPAVVSRHQHEKGCPILSRSWRRVGSDPASTRQPSISTYVSSRAKPRDPQFSSPSTKGGAPSFRAIGERVGSDPASTRQPRSRGTCSFFFCAVSGKSDTVYGCPLKSTGSTRPWLLLSRAISIRRVVRHACSGVTASLALPSSASRTLA